MSTLRLYFLGTPRIELADQAVEMDTRKAVAMLAYLALSGERQSRDNLAALLWSEFDDARAKAALRRTLSTLKTAVGAECLFISREAIGLERDHVWCDVAQFQLAVQNGDWETAVSLYRDDFMTGFSLRDSIPFDDWQVVQAETLRREMSHALEMLCQQQQGARQSTEAITTAHHWLTFDPLREEAHRLLMLLYAQAGQRNKALNQYRACVRILDEELGVAPLPPTVELYEAIRNNEISTMPTSPSTKSSHVKEVAPVSPVPRSGAPFVGRQDELAQMEQLYQQINPDGRLLIIEGEAGIGKTMLAETFLMHCQAQAAITLSVRCYEGENNLAYAPIIQSLQEGLRLPDASERLTAVPAHLLAEASRLLPEISAWQKTAVPLPDLDSPGAQNRFYEGVGQVLQALLHGAQPGILFWDDVHWLDSASLDLLLFLLRRWQKRPYLICLSWRSEAIAANHPLVHLSADLHRANVCAHVPLARFSAEEVQTLLTRIMPTFAPTLSTKLFRETEGLPFFVVEYLNAMQQLGLSVDGQESWEIPRTVRDLLITRLSQIDDTERQLLQTAATIGHAFDYDLLHLTSGRSAEETVSALDSLVARGLLMEYTAVYDFTHAKLRQLAYDEMGLARRRLLHRRIAEALSQSGRRAKQTTAVTAEIATHYRQAGLDAEAVTYFVQAGDQARALFAHQEAIYYYQSALALGADDAWQLHESCGDMHVRLGAYPTALTSYETAASLAPTDKVGQLEHKLGQVYMRQGAWSQAEAQLHLAREQMTQEHDLAQLYIDWSYVAFNLKELAQAEQYAKQGQQFATTPHAQAQCHNILGILARHNHAFAQAITHFEQAVTLAGTHDLPDTQIAALNNLALVETAVNQTIAAQDHLQTALALCQTYGDRHREAALHNNLADLYHQMGDENKAMVELKTAVAIYAEIGGQPGNWQAEIWKLTEW